MEDGLLARILAEAGVPELLEILADRLSPTDLQSLLLAVLERRAEALSPADVLRRYETDAFVGPASVAPQALLDLDRLGFSLLPEGWEALELAPVSPLGTIHALADLSQHLAVSTVRLTEVVADSTNVLALEAASRRRRDPGRAPVRLAASHRLLRGQRFPPPWRQHFRLFGLAAAGRGAAFEHDALAEQVDFHLRLLDRVARRPEDVEVALTDISGSLGAEAMAELSSRFASVRFRMAPERESGRSYYERTCFHVHGDGVQLADGGFTSWTQRLLSDRKERLLVSGLGSDLLVGER